MRLTPLLSASLLALPLACGGPDEGAHGEAPASLVVSAARLGALGKDGRLEISRAQLEANSVIFDASQGAFDFSKIQIVGDDDTTMPMSQWLAELRRETGLELENERYFAMELAEDASAGVAANASGLGSTNGLTNANGVTSGASLPGSALPSYLGWHFCGTASTCIHYLNSYYPLRICRCSKNHGMGPIQWRHRGGTYQGSPFALPALPGGDGPDPEPPYGSDPASEGSTGGGGDTSGGSSGSGSSGTGSSGGTSSGGSGSQSAGGSVSGGGNAGGW